MRLIFRLVPLLAGVLAGAVITLHSTDVVDFDRGQLIAVIIVLALVSVVEGLERVVGGLVREDRLKQVRQFSETLRALLVELVDKTQVDWKSISVSAFLVRRRWRWFGPEQLHRVGRERIRSTPRASKVVWTRGKGVIGQCWDSHRDFGLDLRAIYAKAAGMTEEEWSNLPDHSRGRAGITACPGTADQAAQRAERLRLRWSLSVSIYWSRSSLPHHSSPRQPSSCL